MAASKTVIANLALSHLGVGKDIANLESENSAEARACRRVYNTLRDEVLRAFHWPFATKIASLALIAENPNDEWAYSYVYPTDCLEFRRILSGIRNDTRQSLVPYRISNSGSQIVLFTDQANAIGEYTFREEVTERYPSDFVMALSALIAGYIAPQLSSGDPFKMAPRAFDLYASTIATAKANALNEEKYEEEQDSEFIRARE
jgi:hypothetical protein